MKCFTLMAVLASTTALVSAAQAHAQAQANAQSSSLPQNAQLVSGAATVKQTGANQTTITQASQSAILNWQSFSIGKGDTVDVVQPGTTSVLLNRVTGQAPSTIAGQLNANGQVFLINPNGIVIGKTGVVQASGFVASTLDISDSDFLAGRLNFKATGPSAAVVHAGTIRITPGGYAALLGGSVIDTGEIAAPLGKVAIGAGSAATLDLSGDGFLQVALTGTTDATGVALLSASDARDAVRQTVNMDGVSEATSATGQDGHVVLSGTIDTSDASGAGGNVKVLGTTLNLAGGIITAGNAQVETSGDTVDFTGIKVSAGNWLVDPTNLTIDSGAAATISSNLATTDVTLQTTASGASGPGVQAAGAGDIVVTSAITWGTSHQLTLNAYHGISILVPITVTGAGTVNLTYDASDPTNLGFGLTPNGFTGFLSFTSASHNGALNINGSPYTLVYSVSELDAIDGVSAADGSSIPTYGSGLSGNYALAKSLDASGRTYTGPVVTSFTGTVEGLGHTISNLFIQSEAPTTGLIGQGNTNLRDFGLVSADIEDMVSYATGGLVGEEDGGTISQVFVTGLVKGGVSSLSDNAGTGGLVGFIGDANVSSSFSTATVSNSSGSVVGGLIGESEFTPITNAYSTGNVTGIGSVGGLIGNTYLGSISQSYATGAVNGQVYVGGLIGANDAPIKQSYATGSVTGQGADVGGLLGNTYADPVSDVYATGNVTNLGGGYTGGLIGYNEFGTITNAYSTGDVVAATAPTSSKGASIGLNIGTTSNVYFDMSTSGLSNAFGTDTNQQAVTGETTTQLQGAPPSGFSSSVWATGPGLYPYLKWQYPNGAQAITGTALSLYPTTDLAGAGVNFYMGGSDIGATSTGANGYYYFLVPAGTIKYKTPLGTTLTLSGNSGVDAIEYIDTPAYTATAVDNRTITLGRMFDWVSQPTWSATLAGMRSTFGASEYSRLETTAAFNHTDIYGLLPIFTIDVAQDVTGTFKITEENPTGTLIDAAPITVEPGGTVMLIANGPLAIDAPITVKGAGVVDLRYDDLALTNGGVVDPTAFSFNEGASVSFLTSTGGVATTSQGGKLDIGTVAYTLVYSAAQFDAIDGVNAVTGAATSVYGPGANGYYALARTIDAGGTTYGRDLVNNFEGTFEGLNNSIDNLSINDTGGTSDAVGLFGAFHGLARDINLVNIGITDADPNGYHPAVGGLMGYSDGSVYNASVSGDVNAAGNPNASVGGMIGYAPSGTIYNAQASDTVEGGQGDYIGGLVGLSYGATVSKSSATGNVTATRSAIGGLMGYAEDHTSISQSFATGNVDGGTGSQMGGLVGSNYGTIDQTYATGALTSAAGATMGGLVGANSGVVTNSYWDTDTSGQTTSAAGTGLTTAQLQSGTLPAGFNPAVWVAAPGQNPRLKPVGQ